MITIIFEVHATTEDNERDIASGHSDARLSQMGMAQAKEMGERYRNRKIAAVFCSDLRRAKDTAEIAFTGKGIPIIADRRLRECDYGDFTRMPSDEVKSLKVQHIVAPFPNGQSYQETTDSIREFLQEVLTKYDKQNILIVGHAGTRYALEHLLNKVPLKDAIEAPWAWQPGWTYYLKKL